MSFFIKFLFNSSAWQGFQIDALGVYQNETLSKNSSENPPQILQGESHEVQRLFDFFFVHVLKLSVTEIHTELLLQQILRKFSV